MTIHLMSEKTRAWTLVSVVFLCTFLYYTRLLFLQGVAFLILIFFLYYWNEYVLKKQPITAKYLLLRNENLVQQVVIALALSVLGRFVYQVYVLMSRGKNLAWGWENSLFPILTIIIVASSEELLFRGYFNALLKPHTNTYARMIFVVVAMAAYKNVIHFWTLSPPFHLELLAIGIFHNIVIQVWMERSKNLVGPLLLHVVWDILVYAPLGEIPDWVF